MLKQNNLKVWVVLYVYTPEEKIMCKTFEDDECLTCKARNYCDNYAYGQKELWEFFDIAEKRGEVEIITIDGNEIYITKQDGVWISKINNEFRANKEFPYEKEILEKQVGWLDI